MGDIPELNIVDGMRLCSQCLDGKGGICHAPGCMLIRCTAPDIPIRESIIEQGGSIIPDCGKEYTLEDPEPTVPPDLGAIIDGLTDELIDPDRPFTGQPHTDAGERGKTEVKGIRFRDLADCIVQAFVDAASLDCEDERVGEELRKRAEDGTLNYNDVYKLDLSKMDPLALMQNVCCRVEMRMGIYPNVPGLETSND